MYCEEAHLGLLSIYGGWPRDKEDSRGLAITVIGIEITSQSLQKPAERIDGQPVQAAGSYKLSSCP